MPHKNTLGAKGEDCAARYLENTGYTVVRRNYHSRMGEIDIIAENGEFIIFAEVKARNNNTMCAPAEAVDMRKQKKIIKTALMYIMEKGVDLQPRFDVIEVYCDEQDRFSLNHIENAFSGEGYTI